jgi:hypothetical protein
MKTYEDGWGCVPELQDAVDCLNDAKSVMDEIEMCVRQSSTEEIVSALKNSLEEALGILEDIDTSIEYVTIDENE